MHISLKKALNNICSFFDTPYFAMALAIIELVCYYLGLDLLIIITISLAISFAFLFKKNLNCSLVIFLFMASMISLKNSPANDDSTGNSGFFFQPAVYVTCIIFVCIPVFIIIFKSIKNILTKKIEFDKFALLTLILGILFITNGILKETYNPLDTMFGAFMFFFFVVLFFAILPFIKLDKKGLNQISKQVAVYLLVPLIELIVYYSLYFAKGNTFNYRLNIFLGWGNRNTLGMIFAVCLPFLLFLVKNDEKKHIKILMIVLSFFAILGTVFTFSRQAYLFIFVLISFYLCFLFYTSREDTKSKYKKLLFCWCGGIALILLVCEISGFFESIGMNGMSYSRISLWLDALNAFKHNPFFGGGFFYDGGDPIIELSNVMPYCCHNTIFQVFGSCGIFAGFAYLLYRLFSIKKIFSDLTIEKAYPFMACSMIVLMSLLDIHIFDLFGSAIYVVLLAMSMSKSKEKESCGDCYSSSNEEGKDKIEFQS